ncbi:TPM domain-containing protein [Paludibacterium denitrificans]|uniref:TPM domain-containing protein n=1 Tax=Paludibacterium denitrificans TaxID=2675226 RepID=UPI001E32B7CF|nr:TPM domain-containing protein [Paludibacterium denitrificans]
MWDTEDNTGVLVYVLMAERKIEIIADRGIASRVPVAAWQSVCRGMQQAFAAGRFVSGLEEGMQQLHALLVQHVPNQGDKGPNELPDEIVLR